ncbi:MAG: aminoacyl-tRNA hydrolase [Gammaproteobacteria bacterium]|nr:aminoacyl-tRNA hydrolase [Gammaproteobacteria bacterium]MCB1871684.1 aminoacyl-tRNA hydrolase [Gammaproteobacteria bacterium]MCB1905106.1 aminoacyl-tRNA hydrolase [Gammaproteobacteria bacterium]
MPVNISADLTIPDDELEITAIRAQGAGGQNVNKVSTAIHLRFDIRASSLPERYKERLLQLPDQRVSKEGVIVLKAQKYKSQEKNRAEALSRLLQIVSSVTATRKRRIATQPSKSAQRKRLDGKRRRSLVKILRGKIDE